jgi:cytochrome o ubiquinol oxidase subunit 3
MTPHIQNQDHKWSNDKVLLGIWIYILSDCVLFAGLFATYAVQHTALFGGPGPADLFSLPKALIETLLLLTSSFTCGLAVLFAHANKKEWVLGALAATLILGLSFVSM